MEEGATRDLEHVARLIVMHRMMVMICRCMQMKGNGAEVARGRAASFTIR